MGRIAAAAKGANKRTTAANVAKATGGDLSKGMARGTEKGLAKGSGRLNIKASTPAATAKPNNAANINKVANQKRFADMTAVMRQMKKKGVSSLNRPAMYWKGN